MLMKLLKWIGIFVGLLLFALIIFGIMANESLPEKGVTGLEADNMARKMETSLGKEHWEEIQYIQWTFAGQHHFLWDKHRNLVRIQWDNHTVFLSPRTENGLAFSDGVKHSGEEAASMIKTAEGYFNNDMFWLVAPFKTFDPGVTRSIVDYEGENRLLVTYASGGTTPGDSYLWKLDESGKPVSYKMWTKIIPIGGVETSWENWHTLGNGVEISHFHKGIGPLNLIISNVSVGYNMTDMACEKDPFKALLTVK